MPMIKKQDIMAMARNVAKFGRGQQSVKVIHPRREWLIGVVLFFVVLITGGIFNATNYLAYENIEEAVQGEATGMKEYRSTDAEAVAELYAARQAEYERLRGTAPASVVIEATEFSSDGGEAPTLSTESPEDPAEIPPADSEGEALLVE